MQLTLLAQRVEKFSGLVHEIYAASAEHGRRPATVGLLAQSMEAIEAILFNP
jgi:hypothetical protein